MASRSASNQNAGLRNQVFALLNRKKTPSEAAITVLSQCQAHIKNRIMIEQLAKECGLTVSGLVCNEHLELYYGVRRGSRIAGYVSKGWNDPGFRIGDLVTVPKWRRTDMKEHLYNLLTFSATRGVAVSIEEEKNAIELHLDSVIYTESVNKEIFARMFQNLQDCVERAHDLIPS